MSRILMNTAHSGKFMPSILRGKRDLRQIVAITLIFVFIIFILLQLATSNRFSQNDNFFFASGEGSELDIRSASVVKPFQRYHLSHMVLPFKRISTCLLPKNMSTLLNSIFCFLANTRHFMETYGRLNGVFRTDRTCDGHLLQVSSKNLEEMVRNDKSWAHFAFIREPKERFLSGFLHICIETNQCFNCTKNNDLLLCFLQRLYLETDRWVKIDPSGEDKKTTSYILEMLHLTPQNWQCDFANQMDIIEIVRYSPLDTKSLYGHIERILLNHADTSEIAEIMGQLRNQTTIHQTVHNSQRKFYLDTLNKCSECMQLLKKIYYFDYILFNYSFSRKSKTKTLH